MSTILIASASALVLFSYKTIISPLIDTISSTKDIVVKLVKITPSNISEKINDLLIVSDIDNIKIFISEINNEQNPTPFIKTFENYIKDINEALSIIKQSFQNIESKVLYHNTLYFSKWRTLDCDKDFDIIIKKKMILNDRFNMLINILKIPQKI
jgi:cell fate (sporulation/competence/biofilm development) regulator YmcA (YheA/YmcA/DUF963 family)